MLFRHVYTTAKFPALYRAIPAYAKNAIAADVTRQPAFDDQQSRAAPNGSRPENRSSRHATAVNQAPQPTPKASDGTHEQRSHVIPETRDRLVTSEQRQRKLENTTARNVSAR